MQGYIKITRKLLLCSSQALLISFLISLYLQALMPYTWLPDKDRRLVTWDLMHQFLVHRSITH